ncbi:MAG: DUF4301 family protein [Flavobacteriaceae bacterium]|nr:DUF4301 family protein [Flavobacteriaceae bacterium]
MKLAPKDIEQLKAKGISTEQLEKQLKIFRKGLSAVHIMNAATIGKGITKLSDHQLKESADLFDSSKDDFSLMKFVPASGQATRMFKFLFEFLDELNQNSLSSNEYLETTNNDEILHFHNNKERLPFFNDLKTEYGKKDFDFSNDLKAFVSLMLMPEGMNLGQMPKGLIDFHIYGSQTRTAFEEHLHEATGYAFNKNGVALHFTVSPEHKSLFREKFSKIQSDLEEKYGFKFAISFSEQDPTTDTIAVDLQNKPIRNEEGALLFRPSGHGALLHNLNALETELVFISNIDNVAVENRNKDIARYRKALGGFLIKKKNLGHNLIERLNRSNYEDQSFSSVLELASKEFNLQIPKDFSGMDDDEKRQWLISKLNRPLRVCGMVKNEGQPGGGPFWVDSQGEVSLQIVEASQIDTSKPDQFQILNSATHFNPVDLVCWLKDWRGKSFDLLDFSDPDSAFISEKTYLGKPLKALELPGLWNGGMANWITLFVEVPISTFNPVKTVNDLFGPMHSGS